MARKVQLKPDVYKIVSSAVETGIAIGIRRAYKHSDRQLPEHEVESLKQHVENEVMNALSDVVKWE